MPRYRSKAVQILTDLEFKVRSEHTLRDEDVWPPLDTGQENVTAIEAVIPTLFRI
jgi:hypothetical protein